MKQTILSHTTISGLIHKLKISPSESPYFIGQSSQADLGQECSHLSTFEGALVFADHGWTYISFKDDEAIIKNNEFKIKQSHFVIENLNTKYMSAKSILQNIDKMNNVSLTAKPQFVFVHIGLENRFKKINQFSNHLEATSKYPQIAKFNLSTLNQWQSFELDNESVYFKSIYLSSNYFDKYFVSESSRFPKVKLALLASLISIVSFSIYFNQPQSESIKNSVKTFKTVATLKIQKSHPQASNNIKSMSVTSSASETISAQPQRLSGLSASLGRLSRLSNFSIARNSKNNLLKPTNGSLQNVAINSGVSSAIASGQGGTSQFFKGNGTTGSSTGRAIAGMIGDGGGLVDLIDKETRATEGLDKEEIAKVIKKNLGQVLYCYERQLSANSQLFGKMTVQFQIDSSGKVEFQKIADSSISDRQMEACVLGKISKFLFPQPKDGMKVLVNYPFLFKSVQ